ncbi:hypothetical protein NDN08_000759 [Rhodosorus marinus]|uniref:Exportin-4 n=1 Tax=Rhodosorus marinus TaxID=101924 RepID=A0AAV8UNW8_9RHOD|nr:hypothetical protein NDN08_000759 [Rhodosorus marinus]
MVGTADPELMALAESFQVASQGLQVPSARIDSERALLSLRDHPRSVDLAMYILSSSGDPLARFQAAIALQHAVATKWVGMDAEFRYGSNSLRVWIVTSLAQLYSRMENYERREWLRIEGKISSGAMEEEPRESFRGFLSYLCDGLNSEGGSADSSTVCAQALSEIVDELTAKDPRKADKFEADEETVSSKRRTFTRDHLIFIFIAAAKAVATFRTNVIPPCVAIIERVLSSQIGTRTFYTSVATDREEANHLAHLLHSWQEALKVLPDYVDHLFKIYDACKTADGDMSDLMRSCQNSMIYASGIQPEVLGQPGTVILKIVHQMEERNWSHSESRDERLAYAEFTKSLLGTYNLEGLIEMESRLLQCLAERTVSSIPLLARGGDEDDRSFNIETRDVYMEAWAKLCLSCGPQLREELNEPVDTIFRAYVRSELLAAEYVVEEQDEEEQEELEDESREEVALEWAAILARFSVSRGTLNYLGDLISNYADSYERQANGSIITQEQFYRLVMLAGFVLADEYDSYPSIPAAFGVLVEVNNHGNENHKSVHKATDVLRLYEALLRTVEAERNLIHSVNVGSDLASPRLGCAIVASLSRVSSTYLLPISQLEGGAFDLIPHENRVRGRTAALSCSAFNIVYRPWEPSLADAASSLLLKLAKALAPLSDQGLRMFPELRNEELWSSLLESLFGDEPGQPGSSMSALPKRSQRSVGEALISGRRSTSLELVEGLFKGLEAVLKVGPDNPAALDAASVWTNVLAGCAKSDLVMQREIAPVFLRELRMSAVHVVKLFARSRPEICRDVNKLTERFSSSFLVCASQQETAAFMTTCASICASQAEFMKESQKELRGDDRAAISASIFKLLRSLLENEVLDVNTESLKKCGSLGALSMHDAADVVFFVLPLLIPLISDDLMLPKVRARYTFVIASLVLNHPGGVVSSSVEMLGHVIISLQTQMVDLNQEISRRAFEAVSALAGYMRGKSMRGEHSNSKAESDCKEFLLPMIVEGIATGNMKVQGRNWCANALLDLMILDQDSSTFRSAGEALLARCGNPENRSRMLHVLQSIHESAEKAKQQLHHGDVGRAHQRKAREDFFSDTLEFSRKAQAIFGMG